MVRGGRENKKENGNIAKRTVIILGHSNFNSDECVAVVVEAIKIHPQAFNKTTRKWGNDIALLHYVDGETTILKGKLMTESIVHVSVTVEKAILTVTFLKLE